METFYTIYKISNKINGKFYIGSHKTKNLDDDYMGSGKYLGRAIEKYGLENFKKEILFIFDNPEEMYEKEAEIVNEDFLAEENTYNLRIGGFGGWDYINKKSNKIDKILAGKIGNLKQKESLKENYGVDHVSQLLSVRIKTSIRMKEKYPKGKNWYSFKDKKHTTDTKRKIGDKNSISQNGSKNSQFGTMWITNGTENKKIQKNIVISEGWYKGRKIKKV